MRGENAPLYPEAVLSGGVTSNTGDSIRAGMSIGAKTMNMHSTWAAPVFHVPGEDRGRLSTMERSLPGSIMVNQKGKRYLNEAASYHVTGQDMAKRALEEGDASPSYMIFDHTYRHLYAMGPLYPLMPLWLHNRHIRSIVSKARTIGEDLARKINIDPAALSETVKRFNSFCRQWGGSGFPQGRGGL